MNNYREQNGCHNCHHAFGKYDYDEPATFYCTLNAPPRPLCLSVSMKECIKDDWSLPQEERDAIDTKAREDWYQWSEPREVEAFGICDSFSQIDLINAK